MTNSQEAYDKAKEDGKVSEPFLQLAKKVTKEDGTPGGTESTGVHKVKFIGDEVVEVLPYLASKRVPGIKYLFEEKGSNYTYERKMFNQEGNLDYFIERMKEYDIGDDLTLEYIKKGATGYVEVKYVGDMPKEDDVPVIEEKDIDINEIPVYEE